MRRDMDLVRYILKRTEEYDRQIEYDELVTECWPMQDVAYHVEVMYECGLLDARVIKDSNGGAVRGFVNGLTWAGQDYLDAIRNDTVWTRTKRRVAAALGSTTMDIIKQVAIAESLKMLGI